MPKAHPPDAPCFIYGLVDPRDGLIRYVGKSLEPEDRLRGHIREAEKHSGRDTPKIAWIRKLLSLDLKPQLVILEQVTRPFANEAERKWIAKFTELVNLTSGGDGWDTTSAIASSLASWEKPERVEAMSKFMTEWHAARRAAGIPLHDDAAREKMRNNWRVKLETDPEAVRQRFSEMSNARWARPGACERQAEALRKAAERKRSQ